MPSIGLCMIVKNEARVIRRCLSSVLPLVDYILIADTGSTDGTQDLVRAFLQEHRLPGEVINEPWQNFAYNRSFALAKLRERTDIDYGLMIDADEVLVFEAGFDAAAFKRDLQASVYDIPTHFGNIVYTRAQLFSNRLPFTYKAVLHEYLDCANVPSRARASGFYNVPSTDGARSQNPNKYRDDAVLLEKELKTETDPFLISRYTFYLAQSYRDSEQLGKSLAAYLRRSTLGFWEEEVWFSLFEAARLSEKLNLASEVVLGRYLDAFQYRPQRAEPLTELARWYRGKSQWALAHLFALQAITIAKPNDTLFVDSTVYDWRSLDEYAIATYWIGNYPASESASRELLSRSQLPAQQRPRIIDNLNWALRKQGLPDYVPETAPQKLIVNGPACPVCATSAQHHYTNSPYWVCPACDAWFQYPEPPKVYIGEHEPPPESMPEDEREVNRGLARWLFAHVMASQPGPMMDIGAKLPVLAAELQRLGCASLAMDGAPGAEPLGELLGIKIIGADFETWDSSAHIGRFRLITLIHTFEHFYNPVAALRKLRSIIAPDGALFIRLPDHGVAGFERDLTPGHYTIHPFFHCLSSLNRVIAEAGGIFSITETHPLQPGQRDLILRPTAVPIDLNTGFASGQATSLPITEKPAPRPIIALCRPGAIGDILMTLNLIPALRQQNPGHSIYYFCHPSYAADDALGSLMREAGVDALLDSAQFEAWAPSCARAISLIGYPLAEGYPNLPMRRHLVEYFATELGLPSSPLPCLTLPRPARPKDAPDSPYATLQIAAGWSKYKEWPAERWQQVQAALDFPIVILGEEFGRTLTHSIALVANASLHIGIDSFANHLTHFLWRDEAGNEQRIPAVVVFGSTQANASGYPHNTNLTTNLPCQPCFRENPAMSRQPRGPCVNPPRLDYADNTLPACLDKISVDEVVAAIVKAWNSRNTG